MSENEHDQTTWLSRINREVAVAAKLIDAIRAPGDRRYYGGIDLRRLANAVDATIGDELARLQDRIDALEAQSDYLYDKPSERVMSKDDRWADVDGKSRDDVVLRARAVLRRLGDRDE
jgi:hypothetical protein